MAFIFKPRVLVRLLRARGYDASVEDGVARGRLAQGADRQVWIDQGGTLRFQVTRLVQEGRTERVPQGERVFRVSHEQHTVVNVWADLASAEELDSVLDTVEGLAGGAPPPRTDEPPLPIYEASTDDAPPLSDESRMDDTPDVTPDVTPKVEATTGTDELMGWLKQKLE